MPIVTCNECEQLSLFSRMLAAVLVLCNPAMVFLTLAASEQPAKALAQMGLPPFTAVALVITALSIFAAVFRVRFFLRCRASAGEAGVSLAKIVFCVVSIGIVGSLLRLSLSLWAAPWSVEAIADFAFPTTLVVPAGLLGLSLFSLLLNVRLPARWPFVGLGIGLGLLVAQWDDMPYGITAACFRFHPADALQVHRYVGVLELLYQVGGGASIALALVAAAAGYRQALKPSSPRGPSSPAGPAPADGHSEADPSRSISKGAGP